MKNIEIINLKNFFKIVKNNSIANMHRVICKRVGYKQINERLGESFFINVSFTVQTIRGCH